MLSLELKTSFHGVLAVMVNGVDAIPFAVAVMEMSPTCLLNFVPVVDTVVVAPVAGDRVTLLSV